MKTLWSTGLAVVNILSKDVNLIPSGLCSDGLRSSSYSTHSQIRWLKIEGLFWSY